MRREIKVVVVLLCLCMTGCASILSKSQYPVTITSRPEGAHFTVKDTDGIVVHNGSTPSTVSLNASRGYFQPARYTIKWEAAGCEKQSTIITAKIDGWYFGNLLLGGLIGMLVVDPVTGAMWTLPPTVSATLVEEVASEGEGRGIGIYEISQIPEEWKSRLVKLE